MRGIFLFSVESIRPVGARAVIKYIPRDSALVVPESRHVRDWVLVPAQVISVGSGAYLEDGRLVPPAVQPGDKILVPDNVGYTLQCADGTYYIINDRDVVCRLDE